MGVTGVGREKEGTEGGEEGVERGVGAGEEGVEVKVGE